MTDTDAALRRLATLHGFDTQWQDFKGRHQQVGLDTLRRLLRAAGIDAADPVAALAESLEAARRAPLPPRLTGTAGEALHVALPADWPCDRVLDWRIEMADGAVHRGSALPQRGAPHALLGEPQPAITLALPSAAGEARLVLEGTMPGATTLTIAPPRCFQGPLAKGRLWGIGAQIYGLRAEGAGGLGHLGALPSLARAAAAFGAEAIALSPVHALFAADPHHVSPYSPSSRTRLNGWLADPDGLPEVAHASALAASLGIEGPLAAAEAEAQVDYARAVPLRLSLLRALFRRFRAAHLPGPTPLGAEFQAFLRAGGGALEDHARFEALHANRLRASPAAWDWRDWPAPLRDPRSTEVAAFAQAHEEDVAFHQFLQWLAERQLATAQAAARAGGMGIGLVADLAIGLHPGGSRAWSRSAGLLEGISIGAPPDPLNAHGQDWGLTTFAPNRLAAQGYAPFIEDLRAAMAHAGGVRIDHVMGLARIWCIPQGGRASDGAYLRFPVVELMRLLAAESHLSRAVVVGEDLGTVPAGYREMLGRAGLFGLRVLFFERGAKGHFLSPRRYARQAIATSSTHDMPTLAGWWRGVDIGLRARLGLLPEGSDEADERRRREVERRALWRVLRDRAGAAGDPPVEPGERLGLAAARFLGATPSALAMLPIEDATLSDRQVNLPGTTDAYPNWRRRLPKPAETLLREPPAAGILRALDAARRAGARR